MRGSVLEATPEVPDVNEIKNLGCPTRAEHSKGFQGVMSHGVPPVGITPLEIALPCYPCDMDAPTSRALSRPAATEDDIDFKLSLDEVARFYEEAGHSRTLRTLQRYCASGHLEAQKVATALGDKYLVTPQSVARHIAQIRELAALDTVATDRDMSRRDATPVAHKPSAAIDKTPGATSDDKPRQGATGEGESPRYVEQLEKRIEEKDDVIGLLKGQLVAKDEQISELSTRYRETHSLLGAMQRMFAPLLGQADPYVAPDKREAASSVDNQPTSP